MTGTGTHIVALTRWNPERGLEQELSTLAPSMGLGLYDARLKLAAPLPVVVATGLAQPAARERREMLRARGHGAVECDASAIVAPEQMALLRGFELGNEELIGIDAQQRRFGVAYSQIRALLRAVELSSETQTLQTKDEKLALGRALLTGGMMTSKTVTKVETKDSSERQQVAFLFPSGADAPWLLKEYRLNYAGLGEQRGWATHRSFEALIAHLRRCAPAALHDDRLFTHKRRPDLSGVRGISTERVVSNSNAGANTLAAHLLVLGHTERQL